MKAPPHIVRMRVATVIMGLSQMAIAFTFSPPQVLIGFALASFAGYRLWKDEP